MAYLTEAELLQRFEYYTLAVEDQLWQGEDFSALGDDIPFAVHLNDASTLEVKRTNRVHAEMTGYSLEQIREMGWRFLEECVHPASLEAIPKFLPIAYERRKPYQTFAFVQHVRLRKSPAEFSPIITFTKPTALKSSHVICLSPELKDFGRFSEKVRRVVEIDEFKLKNLQRFKRLTSRELDTLRLLALGHNNPRIAEQLAISRQTVETHRKRLKAKLDLKTHRDIIRYALAFNLAAF